MELIPDIREKEDVYSQLMKCYGKTTAWQGDLPCTELNCASVVKRGSKNVSNLGSSFLNILFIKIILKNVNIHK